MNQYKEKVKLESSEQSQSRSSYEQDPLLITCNNSKADVIKDARQSLSHSETSNDASEVQPNTPTFTTGKDYSHAQQFIRDNCTSIDQLLQPDTLEKLEMLLKTCKDSFNHKNPNIELSTVDRQRKIKGEQQIICKLGLDRHGFIRYAGANQWEVFGRSDLNGFNFFDDLMASYNKTYFQEKFGRYPFLGMPKPSTFLRFSLQHLNDDMEPIVVTCKVVLLYTPYKDGQTRKVKGVKIFARRSGSDSTKNFQEKILKSTMEAGKMAINQLKQEHYKKQVTRSAMIHANISMYPCDGYKGSQH